MRVRSFGPLFLAIIRELLRVAATSFHAGDDVMMYRMMISPCALLFCATTLLAQAEISLPVVAPSTQPAPQGIDETVANLFQPSPTQGDGRNFWASGDYMLSWVHGMNLPPLVTTSFEGTPRSTAGVPGNVGTSQLYGGYVNNGVRSGMQFSSGWWFSEDRSFGIETGFTLLSSASSIFSGSSGGTPILARPYIDATTGAPQAVLVAFPGVTNGTLAIGASSGNLFSMNIDLVERNYESDWYRINTLFGYRYYSYNENIRMQQILYPTEASFAPGTTVISNDHFGTRNIFNGVDLGARQDFVWNSLTLQVLTKIALGRINSLVGIDGNQTTTVPGSAPVVTNGGVYALSSNIGAFSRSHLQVMPELGTTLMWQAAPNLQFRLGYNFMLLNGVARAANQIDNTINPANFTPGTVASPARPQFIFKDSDVWIQSITFGLIYTF
jgi:hypothetical protein